VKWGSGVRLHSSNLGPPMSALGQKQTSAHVRVMSALPPKADPGTQPRDVRFVPCVDGSELARDIFTFAELVGAAMCSAFKCGSHDRWP